MSFAEIVLRIGASIGGWLIFIGHALTLATLPHADCDPTTDSLWRGTILFGLLALLGLAFVGRGLPWRSSIRWFAIPAVVLAILAAWPILGVFSATVLDGASLCRLAGGERTGGRGIARRCVDGRARLAGLPAGRAHRRRGPGRAFLAS